MTERERARQIERALARIDEALADIEEAAYGTDLHPDDDDALWWACDRFNDEYHKALEVDLYDIDGKVLPSPKRAIEDAIKARLQ